MQLLSPNPFGLPPAPEADIQALQRDIGFSNAYAHFLRTQNGMSLLRMEHDPAQARWLRPHPTSSSEAHANWRELHSFATHAPHSVEMLHADNPLADWFLEIGCDPAGNPFVEVLHGQHRGKIASLDHDLFAGAQDRAEMLQDLELGHINALDLDAQADALCDEALGLVWWHAHDMQHFVQHCLHCDADFWGFVVDEPGLHPPI